MHKLFTLLLLLVISKTMFADVVPKTFTTKKLSGSIKIDGVLDDAAWKDIPVMTDFTQLDPVEGAAIANRTEARITYDNTAIYVCAMMYDTHADSILHELGKRDEVEELNADYFKAAFDTYNNRQDGYVFSVSASGVQGDLKQTDETYDGVWQSAVQITKEGWSVEMKIPYSAIRFPKKAEQVWAVQMARFTRRNREYDQWTLTPKASSNRILHWGTLNGINNIEAPLRLSVTPYLSVYAEKSPAYDENNNLFYQNSTSYAGGADLKYGIDERFTLDMTLLPDFSQVQSDNKVKNLTAFETVYNENRPFFKEGIDLFQKGNLFYSRRIGATPSGFYDIPYLLNAEESIVENPDKVRLLNGMKVSGRTDKGLGIGLFNAVTSDMYATAKDQSGKTRKILTEPLANYNIFVLDQNLAHGSDVFLTNTNVARDGGARDANVTTLQGAYETKKHVMNYSGSYTLTQVFTNEIQSDNSYQKKNTKGNSYSLNISKVSGVVQGGVYFETADKYYDKNDMGRFFYNDYASTGLWTNYNKNNPFWKIFKYGQAGLNVNHNLRKSNGVLTSFDLNGYFFLLFNNNYSFSFNLGGSPVEGRDYYEPRIYGLYYATHRSTYGSVNASTNYNKRLAFDFGGRFNNLSAIYNHSIGYYINPIIRFSDKWSLKISHYWDEYINDRGFASFDENSRSIFGQRDIVTIENTVTTRYLFKNDMALSITSRHYWSSGQYKKYFSLNENGTLTSNDSYIGDNNFNTNFFNVDLSYSWQFAPGSSFIITYKNEIYRDPYPVTPAEFNYKYDRDFRATVSSPQTNSISLKVLYYLDWQYLKKKS